MESNSEQELLGRARLFDLEALEIIYDRYSPALYRYASRMLDSAQLSEECVADTFSRFLAALRQGKGPADYLQAYLFRMAHNWITDHYRKKPHLIQPLDSDMKDDRHTPLIQDLETKLERREVQHALTQLTSDQRQVIALRFLEGWDIEQVARVLEKPPGAVKSLQHRALARLRQLLQDEEEHRENGEEN